MDNQDTGTDETINLFPPITGAYTIVVTNFGGTTGAFTVNVYNGHNPQITTDFNLLVFDKEGNYLSGSSLTTNNIATNVPFEYGVTTPKAGETQVQYVIARSSVPMAPHPATHIRWIIRGNGLSGIGPAEYFTVNTPNTKGHSMANGCNGTAAYSVFRMSIPEYFTSPGPATVYFDKMGNRLATPEVRLQPGVAAADNANTSFFGGDDVGDLDTKPNFSGTSAAAPHAAAIAALVLEAHGGPGSVTPSQMMDMLHHTAFQHDLDPNYASGKANTRKVARSRFTAETDLGLNPSSGVNNANHLTITYRGPGAITSFVFNPEGTAATAGNTTGGNNGLDLANTYFSNVYPGIVWEPLTKAFTVGTSDVASGDVSAAFSNQAPLPSVAGQWWTMTLTFSNGTFTNEKTVRFTVGHGPQHNRLVTNGTGQDGGATSTSFVMADLFGGELLLPDGAIVSRGMTFSGTTSGGGTFSGAIVTRSVMATPKRMASASSMPKRRFRLRSTNRRLEQLAKRQASNGLPFLLSCLWLGCDFPVVPFAIEPCALSWVDAGGGRIHIRAPHSGGSLLADASELRAGRRPPTADFRGIIPWTKSATSQSSPTSITARPRSSINCCANPAPSAPTRRWRNA